MKILIRHSFDYLFHHPCFPAAVPSGESYDLPALPEHLIQIDDLLVPAYDLMRKETFQLYLSAVSAAFADIIGSIFLIFKHPLYSLHVPARIDLFHLSVAQKFDHVIYLCSDLRSNDIRTSLIRTDDRGEHKIFKVNYLVPQRLERRTYLVNLFYANKLVGNIVVKGFRK